METTNYRPLSRVICADDFDTGLAGWVPLTPNLAEDRMEYFPAQQRLSAWSGPMLSNATFAYVGSHGSLCGTYSMKIPTRPVAGPVTELPVPGSLGIAIKRLTTTTSAPLKFEMWYAYTAEQDRPGLGENAVRAFGVAFDVQDREHRYFCGVRYMNSAGGKMQQRWQYLKASPGSDEDWGHAGQSAVGHYGADGRAAKPVSIRRGLGSEHFGKRYEDGGGDGFQDVPDGRQPLCYNETADKINWHYLTFTVDLARREYVQMQSQDRVFDLGKITPTLVEPYPRIDRLLNPLIWIEADTDRRVFLFVDSVVISVDEEVTP